MAMIDETWASIVKTTAYSVVIRELQLKLEIIIKCTGSKIGQDEYPYIAEIKNFLHKAFRLSHGLGFLKWHG